MPILRLEEHTSTDADVKIISSTLQKLIDQVGEEGGTVIVGPGRWEITTIQLRSNMTFRIERGATLVTHTNLDNYPVFEQDPDNHDRQPYHTLMAIDVENLTIEGDGEIDGQGEAFWDEPYGDKLRGAVGLFWRHRVKRVSPLLEFKRCNHLVLRDFTIRNSPGWTVHMLTVLNSRITGLTIRNSLFGPNTDGFDLNGCRDLFISDCDLRCGDDAIILKAFPDAGDCERITVTNCILETHCAAIGLGAETSRDIRDITVSNCVVRRAIRIIQFEMWEAGMIENVTISNISGKTMADVPLERPIYLDIQHHGRTDGALGSMRNVVITNFIAETRGRIMFTAADGATIENVTLRDVILRYPQIEDPEHTVNSMNSSQMSNDNPQTRARRAAVIADNVNGLILENVQTHWPTPDTPVQEIPLEDAPWPGLYRQLPMTGLLCRNAKQVFVNSPFLTSSMPDVPTTELHNSDVTIHAIGE